MVCYNYCFCQYHSWDFTLIKLEIRLGNVRRPKKRMVTFVYRLIILFFTILVIQEMFKEKNVWNQLTCSIVIIPFILRLLMIK